MTSESALIERQMADVELRPFTLDEFHRRRHQKQRNRKIATTVMGLALLAVITGGIVQALGQDDEKVHSSSTILGPGPSPFEGTWTSDDRDGSSQTMEIRRTEGDEHDVVLRDDSAGPCSDRPSTETGRGQVRTATELVVALELSCDDGSTPSNAALAHFTFVYDPETGELIDSSGVVWRQGGPSDDASAVVEGPSPFEGSWVTDGTEQVSAASMVISRVADGDVHEIVMHGTDTTRCAGADSASTITGSGRRATNGANQPGVLQLVLSVELTCDDGSTPVPATPAEEGLLDDFEISFVHDPVTDEMVGSLGGLWTRAGRPG